MSPGDTAIPVGPFGAGEQVVAKAMSPAGTKVQQEGPAGTQIFSAQTDTRERQKK